MIRAEAISVTSRAENASPTVPFQGPNVATAKRSQQPNENTNTQRKSSQRQTTEYQGSLRDSKGNLREASAPLLWRGSHVPSESPRLKQARHFHQGSQASAPARALRRPCAKEGLRGGGRGGAGGRAGGGPGFPSVAGKGYRSRKHIPKWEWSFHWFFFRWTLGGDSCPPLTFQGVPIYLMAIQGPAGCLDPSCQQVRPQVGQQLFLSQGTSFLVTKTWIGLSS